MLFNASCLYRYDAGVISPLFAAALVPDRCEYLLDRFLPAAAAAVATHNNDYSGRSLIIGLGRSIHKAFTSYLSGMITTRDLVERNEIALITRNEQITRSPSACVTAFSTAKIAERLVCRGNTL